MIHDIIRIFFHCNNNFPSLPRNPCITIKLMCLQRKRELQNTILKYFNRGNSTLINWNSDVTASGIKVHWFQSVMVIIPSGYFRSLYRCYSDIRDSYVTAIEVFFECCFKWVLLYHNGWLRPTIFYFLS